MKKALKLFLAYFSWLVLGTLIGTFFYSLYLHSLGLVAGVDSPVFSREYLGSSFFLVSQVLVFISGFLLLGYKIRKPGNPLQLLVYVICQLISVCIIFPLSCHFEKKFIAEDNYYEQEDNTLSPGFFREYNNQVYFFLNDENNRLIQIDTRDDGTSFFLENSYTARDILTEEAAPYKDVLIKNSFNVNTSAYSFFGTLLDAAKQDWEKGVSYWITFISLTLALTSIYALSGFTAWRVANYSLCGIFYLAVLFLNSFYWSPVMNNFRARNFLHSGVFGFFERWTSAPFLIMCNLIFALVLTLLGTITYFIRRKRGH
ncbi:MAG: hypothetical protein MJ185_00515 [Treponema sp.]|nr:hypothetical protein [Treponema sp.]